MIRTKGYAAIGNGLYAETNGRGLSLMDWYRRLQAVCIHDKRDPKGTCYNCGQRGAA